MLALKEIENELQKRLVYPYHWGKKQADDWDRLTNFIYHIPRFDILLNRIDNLPDALKNYAMNRWYNFWSAKAVEYIFAKHPNVIPNTNQYDKLVDFTISGIPFDHKTSVFPKQYNKSINDALNDKRSLILWLYKNQSQQGRKHLKNRLFIILYDSKQQEHWKLKAQISELKQVIDIYIQSFSLNKTASFDFGAGNTVSDCIWFIK